MNTAPIALFAYNRPDHLRAVIDALRRNRECDQTDLIVYSDGPRNPEQAPAVAQVREFLRTVEGFRTVKIVAQPQNLGLSRSITAGVSEVCRQYGRVIVLEDDIVTSPWFLQYMNQALDVYRNTTEVISIHGYVYPVDAPLPETFFLRGADCWGWATWDRGWAEFSPDGPALLAELEARKLTREFDYDGTMGFTQMLRDQIAGKNDSWAVRWHASAFLKNRLTLYPGRSLVQNIGFDGSGEHCGTTDNYASRIEGSPVTVSGIPAVESAEALRAIREYFRRLQRPSRSNRFKAAWQRIFRK